MLTPKQLDDYPARLVALYHQTECDIIADMAKRIAAKDMFIPASQWQMNKLLEMGAVQSDIEKRLAQALGKTQDEVHRIIEESGYKALKNDAAIYEKAGIDTTDALRSDAVKQALENGMAQTGGEFKNITRTTVNNAAMQYYDALDGAYLQVSSGAFDYTTAITNAIKKLSENGIACATYASGHKDYLDVAVRRATLTGLNQAALHAQEALSDELGNDLVEVTAHAGARTGDGVTNHASWQGKVYSRSGNSLKYPSLRVATGYGTGAGLGGWNCRHSFFPFIEGASERAYTDQELEELNEHKYEYNGKKMTEYEATQRQRYIERQIRRYKREIAGLDAAGIDCTDSRNQLAKWQKRQADFIDQTGLKRDYSREVVEGYSSKSKKSRKLADDSNKTVANGGKSDIIKERLRKNTGKREDLHFISDESFNNLTIEARKNGATIIRGGDEIEKHLDDVGASASIIGDTILFRSNVCISDVLEETYHFMQNINGVNLDKPEPLRTYLNEIEAKQYLLNSTQKYKIPRNEVEITQKQLNSYKSMLENYVKEHGEYE